MRILQVTPTYPPAWSYGGITRVVYEITKELSKKGHNVEVWTSDAFDRYSRVKNVDHKARVKVRYFENLSFTLTRMFYDIHITPDIVTFAKDKLCDFDVVHLHGVRTFQSLVVYPFVKKYGVPYILQAHGAFYSIGPKQTLHWMHNIFFGYRLLRDASKVIALSRVEAEQYRGIGVPEEKIAVIPNAIDLSEYANLPPKGSFRKKFGIEDEDKIVLYLGRVHKIKGIDILVRAFADVIKKLDDVRLVIVGPDDGYLNELQALIKALKIQDYVLITGPLYDRDKLEAYVDADVYVLPSRYETFPMSILEAVACGTPIILTENCGITEYFRDKVGLVVKPIPKNLVDALLTILRDEELRDVFRGNYEKVIGEFDVSKTILQLEEVYEAALTSN